MGIKEVADAQGDLLRKQLLDTAALNLKLKIIGDPDAMALINKLCALVQIKYSNFPAFLMELDRIFNKYGAVGIEEDDEEDNTETVEASEGKQDEDLLPDTDVYSKED